MYVVESKALNQAVKRNISRFPDDFMFQLSEDEYSGWISLRSQSVTLNKGRGSHRKYLPYVFTEQGIAMLSSVLHSERAVQINIAIMRAFVQMRELASSNRTIARKLEELEKKCDKNEKQVMAVFDTIRQMMAPVETKKRQIGFTHDVKE
jgi:phage regulator Rha-like protein